MNFTFLPSSSVLIHSSSGIVLPLQPNSVLLVVLVRRFRKPFLKAASFTQAMSGLPYMGRKRKRKRLQLGPYTFDRRDSPSGSLQNIFACGLCHARLCHFFPDAGTCRLARLFFGFLLPHRTSIMISRPQQCTSIQKGSHNSRHTPPCLYRAPRPLDRAKMKVQTEAGEMDRAQPARKILLRKRKVPHRGVP